MTSGNRDAPAPRFLMRGSVCQSFAPSCRRERSAAELLRNVALRFCLTAVQALPPQHWRQVNRG